MKRFILLFVCIGVLFAMVRADEDEYILDNLRVEKLFMSATEVSFCYLDSQSKNLNDMDINTPTTSIVVYLLKDFDIRHPNISIINGKLPCSSCLCCGLLGILPFADWLFMSISNTYDDVKTCIENPDFAVWR
ncbi:MAG: hypothetical protein ACTTJH_06145 [Bacteroidales bacterium]